MSCIAEGTRRNEFQNSFRQEKSFRLDGTKEHIQRPSLFFRRNSFGWNLSVPTLRERITSSAEHLYGSLNLIAMSEVKGHERFFQSCQWRTGAEIVF